MSVLKEILDKNKHSQVNKYLDGNQSFLHSLQFTRNHAISLIVITPQNVSKHRGTLRNPPTDPSSPYPLNICSLDKATKNNLSIIIIIYSLSTKQMMHQPDHKLSELLFSILQNHRKPS